MAFMRPHSADLLGPHRLRGLGGHNVAHVSASMSGTHFGIITTEGVLFMFGEYRLFLQALTSRPQRSGAAWSR